jgi:predicted secreted hydrolase
MRALSPASRKALLFLGIALLSLTGWARLAPQAPATEGWRQALELRLWKFPDDLGAHPDFKTEWWYFTGVLSAEDGGVFGYELTFFRNGVRTAASDPGNPWSVRDIYLAHFTVTDVARGAFQAEDIMSRQGPGLAGARTDGLDVRLLDWTARMEGGVIRIRARKRGLEIGLELAPSKPAVLHGRGGLSRKGPGPGEASYYSSLTDLATKGFIVSAAGEPRRTVAGRSWFDHEFGSGMLAESLVGWDWFGLHLSDGRDLMIYVLRRKDGSVEGASASTLVAPDGKARALTLTDFSVETLGRWTSPRSGGNYPARWRIRIPSEKIELVVAPLLAAQELLPVTLPNLIYWEGAVSGTGFAGGRPLTCEGYIELTGYAGSLRGIF